MEIVSFTYIPMIFPLISQYGTPTILNISDLLDILNTQAFSKPLFYMAKNIFDDTWFFPWSLWNLNQVSDITIGSVGRLDLLWRHVPSGPCSCHLCFKLYDHVTMLYDDVSMLYDDESML